MNNLNENTIIAIMKAMDDGLSFDEIVSEFPQQKEVIGELFETKNILKKAAENIQIPVTKPPETRLPTTGGSFESPYIIKSLLFTMNYKIAIPVLLLGAIVVGGGAFLSKKEGNIAQNQNSIATVQTNNNQPVSASKMEPEQTTRTKNVSSASVDDLLLGFESDASNEQTVASDDGISADMFAQSELSELETENYDY